MTALALEPRGQLAHLAREAELRWGQGLEWKRWAQGHHDARPQETWFTLGLGFSIREPEG